MKDDKINIELSKDEAIILFEFLSRFNKQSDSDKFEDHAEERVLWDIECILEKELSEPLQADYQEIINKARKNVCDKKEQ